MSPACPETRFLKTLSVLLVEDDPVAREETGRFLRRRVGQVIIAPDGQAGLAAFRDHRPRMVVTEVNLPDTDGLTMAQTIRREDPGVPVIVTTASQRTDDLMRSIEIGVDRYVLKPVQAQAMDTALLVCASRLMAKEQLRLLEQREAEARQARHEASRCRLLGGLAHDYNNLLLVILNAVEIALGQVAADSDAGEFLALAKKSAGEARLLARRLGILGCVPGALPRVGPLSTLIRETVKAELAGTPIVLVFEFRGEDLPVRHHRENFVEVVRNLAENAREAMPDGGTFRVSTEIRVPAESGRRLRIRFQDTGRGIPGEHLPLVFEPYFSTKPRGSQRGTGLGLALCEAIVRVHGGSITAESLPEGGSAFQIELPVAGGD